MAVLITGGSRGIGLALAKLFAKDGYDLILTARNAERLSQAAQQITDTYHVHVQTYVCDLSIVEETCSLFQRIHSDGYRVVVLVNNAGIGYAGDTVSITAKQDMQLITVNDTSLVLLTKQFLQEYEKGEIINICSTAAFQPGPYMSTYYASKAFVLSYTQAIAYENHPHFRIYCYCPGPVDTDFYAQAGTKKTIGAISVEKAAMYLYTHRKRKTVIMMPSQRLLQSIPQSIKTSFVAKMKQKNNLH